jgi:hypothetical protein
LLRWYRAGADVEAKLPLLATYLGHGSAVSTHYYLHFIEPLRTAFLANYRTADSKIVDWRHPQIPWKDPLTAAKEQAILIAWKAAST